jgi:ABC-type bacteriocin/lantibiotic exporter with double-glycine peptidase domain
MKLTILQKMKIKVFKANNEFLNNKLIGYFEMKDVTFGYSRTMPALIENFNLKLRPGSELH